MSKDRRLPPEVFIEGIDVVIKLDLGKHKELLAQAQVDVRVFREAAAHQSGKKRFYHRQIGEGKYNDDALRRSVTDIRTNIRHLTDKAEQAKKKAEHHTLIVDTLTEQLKDYDRRYAALN
jgi:hypothetical protein